MTPHNDVPNLGHRPTIMLREQRLIAPALVQFRQSGLGVDGCKSHLRVVDVANGKAWLVPLTGPMVDALADGMVRGAEQ